MGEGAGVLVLEEASAARARGATILGEIVGYGSTSDAYHLTAPEPTGGPAARAIELALADAGVTPEDVDYVNAHGTSTQLNDAAETVALKRALGERAREADPGLLDEVGDRASARRRRRGRGGRDGRRRCATRVIPPTLGYEVPDPELDLDYVPGEARPLVLANGGPPVGDLELVRVRRPQRRARVLEERPT